MFIITSNLSKYKLFKEELDRLSIQLYKSDIEIPEIQGNNFELVLQEKAKWVYENYKDGYFVDDMGLFLEAYPNFPGVCTKFILKNLGKEGLEKLLEGKSKDAILKCKIGCFINDQYYSVEGEVKGTLDFSRNIDKEGPGPISSWFVPKEETKFGSLEHRYRAILELEKIIKIIKNN